MTQLNSIPELINAMGGLTALGRACGSKRPAQFGWDVRRLDHLEVKYWPSVIRAAERIGVSVTADDLLRMNTRTRDDVA